MAYDQVLEKQRVALLAALGVSYDSKSLPELWYYYLGLLGYQQPTLLERQAAYARYLNVPTGVLQASATLGGPTPLALFSSGSQGCWYDPSDLATMFQDAAGTLPVTAVDQPVSIMLDKRLGLARGASLMPDIGTAVLDAGVTLVGSSARFTAAAQNAKAAVDPLVAVINTMFYEVFFTVSNYTGGAARLRVFGTGEVAVAYTAGVTANGVYRAVIDPVSGGGGINQKIQIEAIGAANNSFDVSNVVVKELPGYHVWTTDTTARPILKLDELGKYYLQSDGVNDMLASPGLTGVVGLDYPLTLVCAARADADLAGGPFSVFGGAPPYYEIQKRATANSWNAFVRGAVNASNNETVGTNATSHVLTAEFTSSTVDLTMDSTNASAATAQANVFGTVTEIRVCGGGGGFFSGRFYGGVGRFGALTAAQLTDTKRYLATRAGVIL